jgi:hypothetical protein
MCCPARAANVVASTHAKQCSTAPLDETSEVAAGECLSDGDSRMRFPAAGSRLGTVGHRGEVYG